MTPERTENLAEHDPLASYSHEDLLALIEAQSAENNDLRQRADQFEHLYRDVMTSTAWKLSWPIRAAFKVLTAAKDRLRKLTAKGQGSGQTSSSQVNPEGILTFEHHLIDLLTFSRPEPIDRINLLLTQRVTQADLQSLLTPILAQVSQTRAVFRVICLDPAVTARQVSKIMPQGIDFVFQQIEVTNNPKNKFRIDFHTQEIVHVQSQTAKQYVSKIVDSQKITLLQGGTV